MSSDSSDKENEVQTLLLQQWTQECALQQWMREQQREREQWIQEQQREREQGALQQWMQDQQREREHQRQQQCHQTMAAALCQFRARCAAQRSLYNVRPEHACWLDPDAQPECLSPSLQLWGCPVCARTHWCRRSRDSCPNAESASDGHFVCQFTGTVIDSADRALGSYDLENEGYESSSLNGTRALQLDSSAYDHVLTANWSTGAARKKQLRIADNIKGLRQGQINLAKASQESKQFESYQRQQQEETLDARRRGHKRKHDEPDPTDVIYRLPDPVQQRTTYDAVDRERDLQYGSWYFSPLRPTLEHLAPIFAAAAAAATAMVKPVSESVPSTLTVSVTEPEEAADVAASPTLLPSTDDGSTLNRYVRAVCDVMHALLVQRVPETRIKPDVPKYQSLLKNILCLALPHLWQRNKRAELCKFVIGALAQALQSVLAMTDYFGHCVVLFAPDAWLALCAEHTVTAQLIHCCQPTPPAPALVEKQPVKKKTTMTPTVYKQPFKKAKRSKDVTDSARVQLRTYATSQRNSDKTLLAQCPAPVQGILRQSCQDAIQQYGPLIRQRLVALPYNAMTLHCWLHTVPSKVLA